MISFAPLVQRGFRLLMGRKTYRELCDRQWTLHPSENITSPPAIYLGGELDKVIGVQEETTYAAELKRVQGGVIEHAGTTAYRLRDVTIYNGYVYKKSMKYPLTTAKESLIGFGKLDKIPEAALGCTFVGNRYFGHWLTDNLTLTLAAQQLATAIRPAYKFTDHQQEYSNFLDIHCEPVAKAKCKELIFIDDYGQNRYKRERYDYIRSKLRSQFKENSAQSVQGVMLLRGKSGVQRLLVNENEIAEYLRNQGFIIVDPQAMSAREIVTKTLGAKVVVGAEGSQLVHGLFTLSGSGTIVTLQPPYRFNNVFKDYTDCLGLRYGFVVGQQVANGFEINIEDLARTLDMIH